MWGVWLVVVMVFVVAVMRSKGEERLLNLLLKHCFERICVGDGEWWWLY